MKISIITASWNSEESILGTLHSIAEQDYPRDQLEWIVVDGASTDRTIDLIKGSDFQPDKILSEADSGIYDALNKGVRMATGDIIGILHADDFLASPGVLDRVACVFQNSGAEVLYGDLQYVRPTAGAGFSVVRHWRSGVYCPRKLRWGWMPPHPTLYLRRAVYERAALPNGDYFDTSFNCAADYDFMMRVLGKHGVEPAYLRMVLVKMRTGGISNHGLRNIIRKSREDWQVIRRNRIGGIHTLAWKNLGKLKQFVER